MSNLSRSTTAGPENGGRRPRAKEPGELLETGKIKEIESSPRASEKEQSPAETLILAWQDPLQTYRL